MSRKLRRKQHLAPLVPCAGLLLAACVSPQMPSLQVALPLHWSRPASPLAEAPPVSSRNPEDADVAHDFGQWWRCFDDSELDQLVHSALQHNLDMAAAAQRLHAAGLLLQPSYRGYRPELHARAQPAQSADGASNFFQYGLEANWDLGLFGRRRSGLWTAQAQLQNVAAQTQALRLSLVSDVVRRYVELRAAQQRMRLLHDLQNLQQQHLDLLATRVQLGLEPAASLVPVRAGLGRTHAEGLHCQQAVETAGLGLALLLGRLYPEAEWQRPAPALRTPRLLPAGVPADLLRHRPDIHAAEARVLAAAGELGIARADLYPHVAIGGSLQYSLNLDSGANRLHSALGPTIDLPLFDWGQRRAQAQARAAQLQAAVLDYRQAVLQAASEVEQALALLQGHGAQRQALQEALAAQEAGLAGLRSRQQLGLASRLQDLEMQQDQLRHRLDLETAEAEEGLALVSLYQALGGAPLPEAVHDAQKNSGHPSNPGQQHNPGHPELSNGG